MRLLEPEPRASTPRGLLLTSQIISLFFTGCFVWTLLSATPFRNSPSAIIGRAVAFALLTWIWSAAMLAGLYLLFAEAIPEYRKRILRTSTAAVWFAPATILLTEQSAAAALAALILVTNTTRVLYSEWRLAQLEPDPPLAVYGADRPFEHFALPSPAFSRQLAPGMTLAFLIQTGAAAAVMNYPLLAAGCFAFSAAFLTASAMALGILPLERPRDFPHAILGVILTVLLAAALTVGGSPGGGMDGSGGPAAWSPARRPGLVEMARALFRQWFHGAKPRTAAKSSGTPGQAGPMRGYEPGAAPGKLGDNDFPGVILRPEVKPFTTVVAPVPAGIGFSAAAANPLGIPFAGEYWMFRGPFKKPPYGSFMERGSPAWLGFLTTDHAPLQMEAHHKLDEPIDLSCCSKVEIAIWNGDRYPATVSLELVLMDNERRLSQSLGTAAVRSSPGALPVRETLEFPVPKTRMLERFNEFKVVFQRDRKRLNRSARIEIDRFVLVPAGRP